MPTRHVSSKDSRSARRSRAGGNSVGQRRRRGCRRGRAPLGGRFGRGAVPKWTQRPAPPPAEWPAGRRGWGDGGGRQEAAERVGSRVAKGARRAGWAWRDRSARMSEA
eukprot:344742-Pleurochrysis_carterae.AAC.1